MPAVGAWSDPEPSAPGGEGGGQRPRSVRGGRGRFWRGAPPRAEQPVDRDSGKRGTRAGGSSQKKCRPTPAWRGTAARNDCPAGGALALHPAPGVPENGNAAAIRAVSG